MLLTARSRKPCHSAYNSTSKPSCTMPVRDDAAALPNINNPARLIKNNDAIGGVEVGVDVDVDVEVEVEVDVEVSLGRPTYLVAV